MTYLGLWWFQCTAGNLFVFERLHSAVFGKRGSASGRLESKPRSTMHQLSTVFIHKAGRMKASSMFVSNEWKKISTYSTSQHLTSSNLWRSWSSYHYHITTNPSPKCYFLTAHCFLRMAEPNKLTCFANAFDQLGYANAEFFIIKRWEIVKKGVRLTTWKGGKENPTLTLPHPYRTVPSRRISEKQKWLRDRLTFCRGILT